MNHNAETDDRTFETPKDESTQFVEQLLKDKSSNFRARAARSLVISNETGTRYFDWE